MAETEIKRVNFFDGQFLKQAEFLELDGYHLHMRRRWGFVLFNQSGVIQTSASDLKVVTDISGPKAIKVLAGMAIGKRPDLKEAKEIVLREDSLAIDLSAQVPALVAGDVAIITVHYDEEGIAVPASEGDVPGNTRIRELTRITVHRNNVPGPNALNGEPFVILGEVNFTTMVITTASRQTAFLQGSLLAAVPQVTLSPNTVPGTGAAVITVNSSGGLILTTATNLSVAFSDSTGISAVVVSNQAATSMTLAFTLAGALAGDRTITITVNGISASATLTVLAGLQVTGFVGVDEPAANLLFTINGSGFSAPTLVAFTKSGGGFTVPLGFNVVNANQITLTSATIPANAIQGPVQVQSGGNTIVSGISVTPPATITAPPASAFKNAILTIDGTRFFSPVTVTFTGGASVGPAFNGAGESQTATQIKLRVPGVGANTGLVRIQTPVALSKSPVWSSSEQLEETPMTWKRSHFIASVLLALLAAFHVPGYAKSGAKYTQTLTFADSDLATLGLQVNGVLTANSQTIVWLEFGSDDPAASLPASATSGISFTLTRGGGGTLNFNISQTTLVDAVTFPQKQVLFLQRDATSSPLLYTLVIVHTNGVAGGATENWTLDIKGMPPSGTPKMRTIAFVDQGKIQTLTPTGVCSTGTTGPCCPPGQACQPFVCAWCGRFTDTVLIVPKWPFPPPCLSCPFEWNTPIREDFERMMVATAPYIREGTPLGPGKSQEINFSIEGGERVGRLADFGAGQYYQMVEYRKGTKPVVKITAAGLTAEQTINVPGIQSEPPIYRNLTYILGVLLILSLVALAYLYNRSRAATARG